MKVTTSSVHNPSCWFCRGTGVYSFDLGSGSAADEILIRCPCSPPTPQVVLLTPGCIGFLLILVYTVTSTASICWAVLRRPEWETVHYWFIFALAVSLAAALNLAVRWCDKRMEAREMAKREWKNSESILRTIKQLTETTNTDPAELIDIAATSSSSLIENLAIQVFIRRTQPKSTETLLTLKAKLRDPYYDVMHHPERTEEVRYEPADMALASYWTETIPAHDKEIHVDPDWEKRRVIDAALNLLGYSP